MRAADRANEFDGDLFSAGATACVSEGFADSSNPGCASNGSLISVNGSSAAARACERLASCRMACRIPRSNSIESDTRIVAANPMGTAHRGALKTATGAGL